MYYPILNYRRTTVSNNVTITINQEQLAALTTLGLNYEIPENDIHSIFDNPPPGYVKVLKRTFSLGEAAQKYMTDITLAQLKLARTRRNTPIWGNHTPGWGDSFATLDNVHSTINQWHMAHAYDDKPMFYHSKYNETCYFQSRDGELYYVIQNPRYGLECMLINSLKCVEAIKQVEYKQFVLDLIEYAGIEQPEEIYQLVEEVVAERDRLREYVNAHADKIKNYEHYLVEKANFKTELEKINRDRDAKIAEMKEVVLEYKTIMDCMVDKNSYSGWHAYYALNKIADYIEWYIDNRNARNHGAGGVIVKLKEFNVAFDEATYFLSKNNVTDTVLLSKYKRLKERLVNLQSELDALIINIKYNEGNPQYAVMRMLSLLETVIN